MEETGGKAAESWLHTVKVGCCNSASEHPSDGWRVSASRGKHSAHSTAAPKDRGIKSNVLSWSILIHVSGAVHLRGLPLPGARGPGSSVLRAGSVAAAQPVGSWSVPAALPPRFDGKRGENRTGCKRAGCCSQLSVAFYDLAASVWLCARSASQITNEAEFFFLKSFFFFFCWC